MALSIQPCLLSMYVLDQVVLTKPYLGSHSISQKSFLVEDQPIPTFQARLPSRLSYKKPIKKNHSRFTV